MKFLDGTLPGRPGWRLHHPCGIQEYCVGEQEIRLLVLCKPLRTPDDLGASTTLEYSFSAPREDMIRVRINHFAGVMRKGPEFKLDTQSGCGRAEETPSMLVLKSGRTRLEIEKEGNLVFRFYYDDRLLTQTDGLGAYVTDADYEADRMADCNWRRMPHSYVEEAWMREALLEANEKI